MDETRLKIINATRELIQTKGFSAMTTKDIANFAGVNECTIFRKFKSKKDIVISAMANEWHPNFSKDSFTPIIWELQPDLEMFANRYLTQVTTELVKLSIGLRAPQIYEETRDSIIKVPEVFIHSLTDYFKEMHKLQKISDQDFECLAVMFLSMLLGFQFFKASFDDLLTQIQSQDYIGKTVVTFINGIGSIN